MGKRTELTTKQRLFVEALPVHNWCIESAGKAAGYAQSFVRTRLAAWCKDNQTMALAIEAKKTAIQREMKGDWDLKRCKDELVKVYDKSMSANVGNTTAAKGAIDSLIRMQGGFIDKTHNINTNIEVLAPMEPEERREWLLAQLILIDRQLAAGTALAGDDVISVCAKGPESSSKAITGDKG